MRGAALSVALERSSAERHHCPVRMFKARASDLHSERHKTRPGQAVAFWDVLASNNNKKKPIQNQA